MKKIKFIILIVISLIALSEVYLRIFHFETLKKFKRDLAYIPDSLYGYRYEANSEQEFIWPDLNKKFKFNNQGYYGPDFSKFKKPGSYRIILVGYSVTLGIRSNGNDNFLMKLQNLFKQAGYNVEIINCSIDGVDNFIGTLNRIKYKIPEYHPDLIMYEYKFPLGKRNVTRDVYKDFMLKYEYTQRDSALHVLYSDVDKIYEAKILTKLYDYSYNVRALCRWLINNSKSNFAQFFNKNVLQTKWIQIYVQREDMYGENNKESFTIDESHNMYLDLEKHLDSLNIKFVTYSFASGNKSYPVYPEFNLDIKWTKELRLPNEGHPNDKAHEIIAKKMFYLLMNSSIPLDNYKKKCTNRRVYDDSWKSVTRN